ncbi:MAG: hypothetical protein KC615_18260 [Anaerolineae bacterium]|nr:hypothetical protein [Anaerolineae bacterium]
MGDLTYPIVYQGHWDFPGMIISGIAYDGVHAIRADIQTGYWLAMVSDYTFPGSGSLSPDNQYFAYPVGYSQRSGHITPMIYGRAEAVRIVRTDGNTDEVHQFDVDANNRIGAGSFPINFALPVPIWISKNQIAYQNQHRAFSRNDDYSITVFDIELDETIELASEIESQLDESQSSVFRNPLPSSVTQLDSASYLAAHEEGIALVDRNRQPLELISIEYAPYLPIALSSNQQIFALWNRDSRLFIGDFNQKVLYDLCFKTTYSSGLATNNLAFSPDDSQLAFSYDGYLVILDLETLENQVIDTPSDWVMGWGALTNETLDSSTPSYHWAVNSSQPLTNEAAP